ncbi:hypothetical protein V6N13_080439 [Hibiscus sabdariffa]
MSCSNDIARRVWNEKVFGIKSFTEEQAFEIALLRIGWWLKCKWPFAIASISESLAHPELCSTKIVKKARPPPGNKSCPAFLAEKRFAQLLWIAEHKEGKVG